MPLPHGIYGELWLLIEQSFGCFWIVTADQSGRVRATTNNVSSFKQMSTPRNPDRARHDTLFVALKSFAMNKTRRCRHGRPGPLALSF